MGVETYPYPQDTDYPAGTYSDSSSGFDMSGLLGGLLGGVFSAFGQRSANKANLRIARENRAWQKMMSDTAVQRRMKDLAAAGINPILAG